MLAIKTSPTVAHSGRSIAHLPPNTINSPLNRKSYSSSLLVMVTVERDGGGGGGEGRGRGRERGRERGERREVERERGKA